MEFNCDKVIPKYCHGDCCGPVPFSAEILKKHLTDQQRTSRLQKLQNPDTGEILFLPITDDLTCIFLKKDFKCAIYEDRPEVCQKFGDGTHQCLKCPYLDPAGKIKKGIHIRDDEKMLKQLNDLKNFTNSNNKNEPKKS